MTITSAIVLFATIWFLVLFINLQLHPHSQADAGEVEPGTPASAPADAQIARKVKITTVIAAVLWVIIVGIILSGAITVRDFDWFNRMGPAPEAGETDG